MQVRDFIRQNLFQCISMIILLWNGYIVYVWVEKYIGSSVFEADVIMVKQHLKKTAVQKLWCIFIFLEAVLDANSGTANFLVKWNRPE